MVISENAGSLRSNGSITGDEDTLRAVAGVSSREDRSGILSGNVTIETCDEALADKRGEPHLIDRFAVIDEVEGGIDVGTVMSAHRELGEVTDIAVTDTHNAVFYGRWVTGEDLTGEDFLRDVDNISHKANTFL